MIGPYEIIFKLLLGALLGGIIGFERQTHGRDAGFRTQLLVCVASVLLMIISESYYVQGGIVSQYAKVDPTRIASGAMTGVGFLGAGVILKTGFSIRGLTTAACIWIVSAIGLAIGAGQYLAGIIGFVITVFSLWVLRILEARMPRMSYRYVTLVTDDSGEESAIRSLFRKWGFEIFEMNYRMEFAKKERDYNFTVAAEESKPMNDVIEDVSSLSNIKSFEIRSS
jgi:putative Mg2+ transporter-C (MgtC) family protein